MRKFFKSVIGIATFLSMGLILDVNVCAAPGSTIESGVFADDISLAGMSEDDAMAVINSRVAERGNSIITLTDGADYSLTFSGSEIGYSWSNKNIISQAAALGKSGNVVQRYKILTDLDRQNEVFDIEYSIDNSALRAIIEGCAEEYDREAVDATMTRSNGTFDIVEGQTGRALKQEETISAIADYLVNEWDGEEAVLNMAVEIVEPKGSYEDLSRVTDILGTYTTNYSTSGSSRCANISNACSLINGTTLYPGDEFSTLEHITPFSEANGYFMAGSYLNGQVVESLGGGICQVSTTLYNSVLLAELDVSERHNHSMIVSYVKPSMDAAIAESAGKDFKFVNNTEYPIYIEGYTVDKSITFVVYGVESRVSTHSVSYDSEVIETDVPDTELVYTDASKPAGYSSGIQSAHIGYKARLWKNTYENGNLESREEINSSVYNKAPRSITIGVSTENADIYNMLMEAAASNSVDAAAAAAGAAAGMVAATQPAPEAEVEVAQ